MLPARSSPIKALASIFPNLIILVGIIFVLGGVVAYARSKAPSPLAGVSSAKLVADASLLTERQLAIVQAQKQGKNTYTFSSNFTPGIGRVSDPASYSQSWQINIQKTLPGLASATAIGNYIKK